MSVDTIAEPKLAPPWLFNANSVMAAGFALVMSILIDHLGRLVAGIIAGRAPVLYHNRVELTSGGTDLVLAGGALACLIAGVIFLTVYPGSRRYDTSKLAVLWLILHSFRQGLTYLAETPLIDDSDIALVLKALKAPPGLEVVVGAAGAVGLLLVALAAAPAFLAFAPHRSEIAAPGKRFVFVARMTLLPAIVGALIAVPFLLPDPGTKLVSQIPLTALFTVATLLAAPGTTTVIAPSERQHRRFSWALLVTVLVGFLVFRFALSKGIPIPPDPQRFFAS